MEEKKRINYTFLIRWTRITGVVALVLLILYIALNFKVFTIPDDWVHLHPGVLPGEKWVYKQSNEIGRHLFRGDFAVFRTETETDGEILHVSRVVGYPGERIEFDPDKRIFRANDIPIRKEFSLAGEWLQSPYELIVLGPDEFLMIDNNVLPDEKRIWRVKRGNLIGKFLFRLPF